MSIFYYIRFLFTRFNFFSVLATNKVIHNDPCPTTNQFRQITYLQRFQLIPQKADDSSNCKTFTVMMAPTLSERSNLPNIMHHLQNRQTGCNKNNPKKIVTANSEPHQNASDLNDENVPLFQCQH